MDINITHTSKPDKLLDALDRSLHMDEDRPFDSTSFDLLKMKLKNNPKFQVKG